MFSEMIKRAQNHLARHFESDAAYGGAAITAAAFGAITNSYLAGIGVGLACAVAWFIRTKGSLAALPYFAVSLLAWEASSLYGGATSNTPALYVVLFAILWGICGAFNVWFMIRQYDGDKQDPGAQVVQFGSGPLFWVLLVPVVFVAMGICQGFTMVSDAFKAWRCARLQATHD